MFSCVTIDFSCSCIYFFAFLYVFRNQLFIYFSLLVDSCSPTPCASALFCHLFWWTCIFLHHEADQNTLKSHLLTPIWQRELGANQNILVCHCWSGLHARDYLSLHCIKVSLRLSLARLALSFNHWHSSFIGVFHAEAGMICLVSQMLQQLPVQCSNNGAFTGQVSP